MGYTEGLASMISMLVECDLHRIEPLDPYPDDYEETVERNVREQQSDVRPAIANPLSSIADYDMVLLGSGVWNVRAPMIMWTFAESYDFTGKTIFPFTTFATSGLGTTLRDYAASAPGRSSGRARYPRGDGQEQSRRGRVVAGARRPGAAARRLSVAYFSSNASSPVESQLLRDAGRSQGVSFEPRHSPEYSGSQCRPNPQPRGRDKGDPGFDMHAGRGYSVRIHNHSSVIAHAVAGQAQHLGAPPPRLGSSNALLGEGEPS